jgi:hypothetical protein
VRRRTEQSTITERVTMGIDVNHTLKRVDALAVVEILLDDMIFVKFFFFFLFLSVLCSFGANEEG